MDSRREDLIVKALGISQIVYSASMLDINRNDTSRIKNSIVITNSTTLLTTPTPRPCRKMGILV